MNLEWGVKNILFLGLLIFSFGIYAKSVNSVSVFSSKIIKNKSYNNDCSIGNYLLLANDDTLKNKVGAVLATFGGMSIADFDMGECVSSQNFKQNIFITHFWQKNTEKLNHRLDLFIAYDFKNGRMLSVIIDNENNSYFMGDGDIDLKNALKKDAIYSNNFSEVNLDSNLKFSDLKEYVDKIPSIATTTPPITILSLESISKPLPEVEKGYQWELRCDKDRFNGTKMCYMISGDVMVSIINGNYRVYIGSDHYPRTFAAIKIDNNSALYGSEGHIEYPSTAIHQMMKGKVAYTRYKKWPYSYNRDREIDLSGFTLKFNELMKRYKGL